MAAQYIIGIDEGSQSAKIAVYDFSGNVLLSETEPLSPMHLAPGGVVEHPDDDLWRAICAASKRLIAALVRDFGEAAPLRIAGAGLCTIRFCRCLLRADGSLAQPAISWMDDRTSRVHERANPNVRYVTTSSGYITHRLTGEFRDTVSNYLGVWPLDMDTWDYYADDGKLRKFNLSRDMLLSLQMPGTILGHVTEAAAEETGLPAGLPVAATANDKAVEALGAGCIDDDTAVISLGTYIAAMTPGDRNITGSETLWTNLASVPRRYLYESGGIRRGMWLISWWTKVVGAEYGEQAARLGMSAEDRLNLEAAGVPPGSDGLMVVPNWLAPADKPYRKGMMLGFDGRHTRGHVFRALMEAIALTIKNRLEEMCAELGRDIKRVIVSGGGAKSDLFMQIFADVLDKPVSRTRVSGAAGVGAAICAAVALGAYPSFRKAVESMVKHGDIFTPVPEAVALYRRMNEEVYKHLDGFGDEIFRKSFDLFD